ncbi:hypothetical protein QQX09_02885 [Demequina sp. SYSU T00192]|uniref:Uncharacterized protein n=1 Tax=Demequina litoralis TaxID=3051660 RepID=A0ABT8G6N3_9MICO|nr:hypothetical protein [Demequina sp. SYSU T00192]MDN4474797.1 hypothetical protein [Demequina sp. SYSU T00192]
MKHALAGVILLALAGCATHGTGDLDASDSPVARYDWDPADGGDAALMEGVLELRDGCLYIAGDGDAAGLTTVPVLPRALASWDAEAQVLTYAGRDYAMGDAVSAGGGWGPPTEDMTIPEGCRPDAWGEVMHVQDVDLEPHAG